MAENVNGADCDFRIIIVRKQKHVRNNAFIRRTQYTQKYVQGIENTMPGTYVKFSCFPVYSLTMLAP